MMTGKMSSNGVFIVETQVDRQIFSLMSNSKTTVFHEWEGKGFYLAQFKTPELAIFSYYLESDRQALLIDPTYDSYAYKEIAEKRGSKLIQILLTHYHADYVAGHTEFELPIIMGPTSSKPSISFKLFEMKDGYTFNLGAVWLKVLHTPGHTPESSCFQLSDSEKKPVCLFTGDTIFLGQVGRPDLAASSNVTKEELAAQLFNSVQKIRKEVDPSIRIYPTHGSGSSCGKSISDGNFCTLEKQIQNNYAFGIETEKEFVEKILNEMPKAPSYFFHDAKINSSGPSSNFEDAMAKAHKGLTVDEFKKEVDDGCVIVDSRADPKGLSVKGSYLMTEKGTLASWVGMFITPGAPLVLFCDQERSKDLVERLLRIGYFDIRGYNNFTIEEWKAKEYPVWEPKTVTAAELAAAENKSILDVRNEGEWKAGVVEGSKLLSMKEIPQRHEEVREIDNLYIHCKTGGRAKLVLSLLAQKGITGKAVVSEFDTFAAAGLKVVPPTA